MRLLAVTMMACMLGLVGRALAEDLVVTRNQQQLRGKVKSADSNGVVIEIPGRGVVTVPRSAIDRLEVEAPPAVLRGIEAYEKGDFRGAQLNLGRTITQYSGLDEDWAAKALVYYARSCLAVGDPAAAEKSFNAFLEAYDESHPLAMDAQLGLAETEVARNDIEKALPKFQELTAEYETQLKPDKNQLRYAALSFLNLGKCLEATKDAEGALTAYLKVSALYPDESALPEALYRGALLSRQQEKLEQAAVLLKDLAEQHKTSPFAQKAIEALKETEGAIKSRQAENAAAK